MQDMNGDAAPVCHAEKLSSRLLYLIHRASHPTASMANSTSPTSPTSTSAWQSLQDLAKRAPEASYRAAHFAPIRAAGITLDFTRQRIDEAVLSALEALQLGMGLVEKRKGLMRGDAINTTENRRVEHVLARIPLAAAGADVRATREQIASFADAVRRGARRGISDQAFTDVVIIGIGGSALGPELGCRGLKRFADGPRIHFVANVDGADLMDTLAGLNAACTLFVVISKTFTTDETVTNASAARDWLVAALGADAFALHFVAVTANPDEAIRTGYTKDNIFAFAEGVGGRYSVWSAVGLPIALQSGSAVFEEFLAGAHAMDVHFASAPFRENLPALMGALGVWNRNFQHAAAHAVLPYSQRLGLLPKHLQQVAMESNGKSVAIDGSHVNYPTCPVFFGEAGTNGQHSFHQLLHQGTDVISHDIIIVRERESSLGESHVKLLANAFAQADAFWDGFDIRAATASVAANVTDPAKRQFIAAHKVHRGKQPVSMLEIERLDAFHLGALMALYEHKVFVEGVMWNLNSFDQFGVELGKVIAKQLLEPLRAATKNDALPLVSQFASRRASTAAHSEATH
jgi:glucose-6-phosphate isomerase